MPLILSALFAERREHEMILEDSNRRLQLVLAQREEAERTLSDRNTQLALAGRVALVGSYAYDVNADEMQVSEGYAAIHGLPEGTAETTRSAWRTRAHPEDVGQVERLRSEPYATENANTNWSTALFSQTVECGGSRRAVSSRTIAMGTLNV
jgi:hypothetical protein